jgi:hypothetical protein
MWAFSNCSDNQLIWLTDAIVPFFGLNNVARRYKWHIRILVKIFQNPKRFTNGNRVHWSETWLSCCHLNFKRIIIFVETYRVKLFFKNHISESNIKIFTVIENSGRAVLVFHGKNFWELPSFLCIPSHLLWPKDNFLQHRKILNSFVVYVSIISLHSFVFNCPSAFFCIWNIFV